MSDNKELQAVLRAQQERDQGGDVTRQVISEMKNSLISQYNWEELLQPMPTAISCVGASFVASASPKAGERLQSAEKGFQYLKYPSIQPNLVECGNLGRFALIEAEQNMSQVQQRSQIINNKINETIEVLADPQYARKVLRSSLSTIRSGVDSCVEASLRTDKKFEEWLLYVGELHAASLRQEENSRDSPLSNEVSLATSQARLDYGKIIPDEARKASDLLGDQVKLTAEAFKKVSDGFPTGWDLVGQQAVSDLVGSVTTALNQAITAQLGEQGADPAFAEVLRNSTFFAALAVIVNGKDGNVDWEKARGAENSHIRFLNTVLNDAKNRFNAVATAAEPSQTLKTVLDVYSQVVSDISAEVDRQSYPEKDSDKVKKLQADFAVQYQKANTLAATARSLLGSAANNLPLFASVDPIAQAGNIDVNTAQAQTIVELAKIRLATTQQTLTSSQENYTKTTEFLVGQQNKVGEIQVNLNRITSSDIALKEIQSILLQSIKVIISLKQQVANLVRFFRAMSSIIETIANHLANPFLETVNALVSGNGEDPNKQFKIGGYTLTDFQRSQLFSALITTRAYFGVFGDISKIWSQLSRDNMPGLRMCDELTFAAQGGDPGRMRHTVSQLDRWSKDASSRTFRVAHEKQREASEDMERRAEDFRRSTPQIASPQESTLRAIKAGVDASKQAAQASLQQRTAQSPLTRFTTYE